VGHLVSRRDRNRFAQSMGFGVPAQLHHVYYEWADAHGLIVAALFLSVIPLCWMIVTGGKGILARADVVLANDTRAPVLLLRSFEQERAAEKSKEKFGQQTEIELQLYYAVAGFGPFIAVGQPGEEIDFRGAARAYYAGQEWRDAVVKLRDAARLVVVVTGDDEGLAWEIDSSWRAITSARPLSLSPARRTWPSVVRAGRRSRRARLSPLQRLATGTENVVAIYHVADSTVVPWSSVPLKDNDFGDVMRLALYGRCCNRQA
jgi:hypothetical protein